MDWDRACNVLNRLRVVASGGASSEDAYDVLADAADVLEMMEDQVDDSDESWRLVRLIAAAAVEVLSGTSAS